METISYIPQGSEKQFLGRQFRLYLFLDRAERKESERERGTWM